jgi:KDO2-lipid IV(A) lauroyltransferase
MRAAAGRLTSVGTSVLGLIRYGPACLLARTIGTLYGVLWTKPRRVVDRNLAHVAPGLTARERRRLARATFRQRALAWIDFLRLPLLGRAGVTALVVWRTRDVLDAALARGKGALVVSPHLGGLDLTGVYLAACGYSVAAVVEDIEPRRDEVWRRYRAVTGMKVLSRRTGAVAAYRTLQRGGILGLIVDRLIDGPGIRVPFGESTRMFPVGPAAFALRAGAPILVCGLARRANDRPPYELFTEAVLEPTGSVEDLTRSIASAINRVVERHPDQWFAFQDGWNGERHADPRRNLAPLGGEAE